MSDWVLCYGFLILDLAYLQCSGAKIHHDDEIFDV